MGCHYSTHFPSSSSLTPNPKPQNRNSSLPTKQKPNKIIIKPIIPSPKLRRRHFLLFCVPISLTVQFNSRSSALSNYDPVSPAERKPASISPREFQKLCSCWREEGNCRLRVVKDYKDFALSDYARVGRAIALDKVGDKEEAIAAMEDVSLSLKGYPEVHAALAAALYPDKHAPLLAENQFTIATLLDPH